MPSGTVEIQLAESFRHNGWRSTRQKVLNQLKEIPEVSPRRVSAFCTCGNDAYIEERTSAVNGQSAEFRIRATKCHDRFCAPCSRERSWRVRNNLLNHMAGKKNLSLITLTLKQSSDPLAKTLDRITTCFRKLRSLPFWKKHVEGGVAIIETKLNADRTMWNVHFHIVGQARYMRPGDFQAAWLKCTGDSHVADARRVGALTGAVSYITKYITKAADHSITTSPKHLREAIIAFTGRRLVSTFGTWRGLQLSEAPDDEYITGELSGTWRTVGTLGAVLLAARAGDEKSRHIAQFIFKREHRGSG